MSSWPSLALARVKAGERLVLCSVALAKGSTPRTTGTAMLYTSRGSFREYDVLVNALPRYVRARFIDQPALFAGRWQDSLEALLEQPDPPERMALDGAEVAAREILELLET